MIGLHHECLDTPHTYSVLNTTLHNVLYTVIYTVMYTVLYNRLYLLRLQSAWLSWLIPLGSPASCTLYLTINFDLNWILYCTLYNTNIVHYIVNFTVDFILHCTKHKNQRYWLCLLKSRGILPFLHLLHSHWTLILQFIVHSTVHWSWS